MTIQAEKKTSQTDEIERLRTEIARLTARIETLTKIESELASLSGLFRTMMENSVGLVAVCLDDKCRVINQEGLKLLRAESAETIQGRSLTEFIHPEDRADFEEMIEVVVIHRKASPIFEGRIVRSDGSECVAELWSMPVTFRGRSAVLTLGRDVTAVRRTTVAQRETQQLLESIFDNVHLMIAYLDTDFNFVRVNQAYAEADGHEPPYYPGKNHFTLFPNKANQAIFRRVIETGEPYVVTAKPFEYAEHPERGVTHWDWSLVPTQDEQGRVKGLILALLNVSERVHSQQNLMQRTEELTKRIQELNCLYQVNRLLREIHIPLREVFQELVEIIPSGWQYPDAACARLVIRDESYASFNYQETPWRQKAVIRVGNRPAGEVEVAYLEAKPDANEGPFLHEERNLIGVITQQVGKAIEERESAQALEESEERFRVIFEQTAEGIVILHPRGGRIIYTNPAAERLTGYTAEELTRLSLRQLVSQESGPDVITAVRDSLRGRRAWSGRLIVTRKEGELAQFEATISPLRDENDQVISYVVVARDVTQETALQEQLRQAQKMEAIGTLAGGIAHDFNNLLWAINGYAELIQDELDPASNAYDNLEALLKASGRAKDLVEQILIFGRRADEEKRILTFSPLVKETLRIIRAAVPTNIHMEQRLEALEERIWANPTHVQQVVMNLCINAVQAMHPGGGALSVRLKRVALDEQEAQMHHDLKPGPHLWLSVQDTGSGMDAWTLERAFNPFFTTKKSGEGTGMGLAAVHGIVASHQGAIWAESVPGQGSTFHVYLPEAGGEVFEESDVEADLPRGAERILLVDDEPLLVDMVGQALRGIGYRLTGLSDSHEALEVVKDRREDFDLIITDLDMPNLSGLDLAREIKALSPDLPIILCTGYPQDISEELHGLVEAVIAKPISRFSLALLIREVLRAGPKKRKIQET